MSLYLSYIYLLSNNLLISCFTHRQSVSYIIFNLTVIVIKKTLFKTYPSTNDQSVYTIFTIHLFNFIHYLSLI